VSRIVRNEFAPSRRQIVLTTEARRGENLQGHRFGLAQRSDRLSAESIRPKWMAVRAEFLLAVAINDDLEMPPDRAQFGGLRQARPERGQPSAPKASRHKYGTSRKVKKIPVMP